MWERTGKHMKDKIDFNIAGKAVTLYAADRENSPLIVLNNYSDNGSSVVQAMKDIGCGDLSLVSVGSLQWNHDMTPWYCPPFGRDDMPYTGGADEYLNVLLDDILPETLARLPGAPSFTGIAGYSLAGLFALYATYHTDRFFRVASMSGSLWYPEFREYASSHEMSRIPDRLYMSLGDREARTRNPVLKTVQDNTEYLAGYYRDKGINTIFELNDGNHFKDAALRSAKGIAAIIG